MPGGPTLGERRVHVLTGSQHWHKYDTGQPYGNREFDPTQNQRQPLFYRVVITWRSATGRPGEDFT